MRQNVTFIEENFIEIQQKIKIIKRLETISITQVNIEVLQIYL